MKNSEDKCASMPTLRPRLGAVTKPPRAGRDRRPPANAPKAKRVEAPPPRRFLSEEEKAAFVPIRRVLGIEKHNRAALEEKDVRKIRLLDDGEVALLHATELVTVDPCLGDYLQACDLQWLVVWCVCVCVRSPAGANGRAFGEPLRARLCFGWS